MFADAFAISLGFDGFEEGFHSRIVIAAAFTAHERLEAVLFEEVPIVVAADLPPMAPAVITRV